MNNEVEAYEGELRDLRTKVARQKAVIKNLMDKNRLLKGKLATIRLTLNGILERYDSRVGK